MGELHPTQKQLLQAFADNSLDGMSLREIGSFIGVDHPQKVLHHLHQLEIKGYLRRNPATGEIKILKNPIEEVVYFPLYGMAQCGPQGPLVEENFIEKIPLPSKVLGIADSENLFLVKACGDSMQPKIDEGDLVVAEKQDDFCDIGTYVVIHNNVPKIKQIQRISNNMIALKSLNKKYEPEILHMNKDEIRIVGKVKGVIAHF